MLTMLEIEGFRETARAAIGASRATILQKMSSGWSTRRKADSSLVTDVDLAAESAVRDVITRRHPDHGILGEELTSVNPGSEFQWVIDPIDGTLNFAHGVPLYGSILALLHKGDPIVGVIDHPSLGITTEAAHECGTFRNGERIRIVDIASEQDIAEEIIAVGGREQFVRSGAAGLFDRLFSGHRFVRTYNDCFGHTLAASGAVGAMIDVDLHIWDIAATRVLIEEAGGEFVLTASPQGLSKDGRYDAIFGKPSVVRWLLDGFMKEA